MHSSSKNVFLVHETCMSRAVVPQAFIFPFGAAAVNQARHTATLPS